ncbi:hypothetical protein [Haladaptatus sp. R4]|nr:hypothetical protein [Haladaptatus sp. R4]
MLRPEQFAQVELVARIEEVYRRVEVAVGTGRVRDESEPFAVDRLGTIVQ